MICFFLTINLFGQKTFIHTTKDANIKNHITTIDHKLVNKNPDAMLFVSQHYGKYNPHQIGVWYNQDKWKIYHEDKTDMPVSNKFNVMVMDASGPAFVHTANSENITKNWTTIDNPLCNNKPDAVLLVTQNWKGTYNPKPIGVWYVKGKWTIYNQDRSAMPNATFNVAVLDKGTTKKYGNAFAGTHTVKTDKKNSYGDYLSGTGIKDKKLMLFVTQNFNTKKYNNHIPAVWHTGQEWSIFNQDKESFDNGASFNFVKMPFAPEDDTPPNPPADVVTNGENVTIVSYGTIKKPLGRFVQVGKKVWKEFGNKGSTFKFNEQYRDEWSVYLNDDSRKVSIRLDLHTKKIYYKDVKLEKEREQYEIINVSRKVNGMMAKKVTYKMSNSSGAFKNTEGKKWSELNKNGTSTFVETGRDDWSVYLFDKSRQVNIQLDLHTKQVLYGVKGDPLKPLYSITEVVD